MNINYFREWVSLNEEKNSSAPPLPLKKGDKGPEKGDWIVKVQKRLGIEPASGLFLDETEAAVEEYQRKNGIRVTGQVGVLTWNSLFPDEKVDEKNPDNKTTTTTSTTKSSKNTILTGIDISHNNGSINWEKTKKGLSFVYIRSSMGDDRTDNNFVQNYQNCKKHGIPWGAYHYYTFGEGSRNQLKNIIRCVPKSFNLPIALDVEFFGHSKNAKLQNNLLQAFKQGVRQGKNRAKKVTYRDYARREIFNILKGLEKHYGEKPIIYCNRDYFEKIIEGDNRLNSYKLWISAPSHRWQDVSSLVGPNRLVCHQTKGDFSQYIGRWSGILGFTDINKAHGKFW